MSLDPKVGDFAQADVLVEGKKIVAVGPNLSAGGAAEIDAAGRIVMPGFIDTHHHQFETALRSFLADGILIHDNSGTAAGTTTYYEYILLTFAPVYRPQDVYINELFGGLSQLDDGVTTVHDVSQIHHTPQHSDAAIQALFDTGRRAAFGYFEGAGEQRPQLCVSPRCNPHQAAILLLDRSARHNDHGWRSLPRDADIHPVLDDRAPTRSADCGAHPLSVRDTSDPEPARYRPRRRQQQHRDRIRQPVHPYDWDVRSGMAGSARKGAQVSIAFPIEMNMRHGMPPILKLQSLGMEPSLSVDVECTLTADFFTQMRSCMNLQRVILNQMILDQGAAPDPVSWGLPGAPPDVPNGNPWPTPPAGTIAPLTTRDVLRFGTMNGAKALRLDGKVGSLTPGKEADIIILDATRINVAPLNQVPGAVVSLMDRTNVETVIVAGKVRKWKGQLLDVDLPNLRRQLEASRDYLFKTANIPQDLFSSQ